MLSGQIPSECAEQYLNLIGLSLCATQHCPDCGALVQTLPYPHMHNATLHGMPVMLFYQVNHTQHSAYAVEQP